MVVKEFMCKLMKKTIFILLSGLSRSSAAVVRMDVTRMYHCSSVETGLMFSRVIYQRVNSSYPETTAKKVLIIVKKDYFKLRLIFKKVGRQKKSHA